MTLESLFTPRSLAVIGSTSPGKLGTILIRAVLDGGFEGPVYAVNPKAQGLDTAPGFSSVGAIGEAVDLAVIASPQGSAVEVLEDCGKAGTRAAVVITSGFSETGNHAGETALLDAARKYGIRMVGPNCAGIANTHHRLYPNLEWRPPQGGVALVSQSGALGGVVLAWAAEQGLGISKFVSYGNGADLGQEELLHYLSSDPETEVVALYIESVRNGRTFMEALAACAARKPVVVIKAGRTDAGRRATASHTGSMAGSDAVYEAAVRECGAVRVSSVEEMLDLCRAFTTACLPRGRRLAIVTNSGGPGVLAADRAAELGLEVAEPSLALKEKLREFLTPNCSLRNPIDLTVEGTPAGFGQTLAAMLEEEYDAALAINVATPYLDSLALAGGVAAGAGESGKTTLASFLPPQLSREPEQLLKQKGIPNYASGERAAAVLAQLARYGEARRSPRALNLDKFRWSGAEKPADRLFAGKPALLEPEAMQWLRSEGIPVPAFMLAGSPEEAAEAASQVGLPVVMKVVSPDILHKSDHGGVVLNIRTQKAARAAFEKIQAAAAGKDFRGVIVYPMIRSGREVLVGMSSDPQFGPVVAFGLGGIYTEIWRDIALRVAPVTCEEAHEMIRSLRSYPLLAGARGGRRADLEALAAMIARFSELPMRYPEIGEIDLNPVFVFEKGLAVGDARVIRRTG